MTPDDELERELESFRPRPPSPELKRRIGVRLNRRRILAFVATAAVAAGVVIVLLSNRPPPPAPDPVVPPTWTAAELPAPSLSAYRHAAARSPEEFESLLDRQAVRWAEPGPPNSPAANLFTLRGLSE
jgi:hypothetical protein